MFKATVKKALGGEFFTRILASLVGPGTIVLAYHDIRHDNDPMSWLRVSESDFVDQICALKKIGRFVSWSDLFSSDNGTGLRFLMTFDDGYHNNFELACPILEEHDVPTVFFVSTHHMLTGESFWFDELVTPIQALQLSQLDLRDFGLGLYSFRSGDPDARWGDIDEMLEDIKSLGNMDTQQASLLLEFFRSEYAGQVAELLHQYRPINSDEVHQMQQSDLFSFGSHSHQHSILNYMDDQQLQDNLVNSKAALSEATGAPIQMISYPNGDFDDRVLTASRDAGYELGFGVKRQVMQPEGDRLAIVRHLVGGFDSVASLSFSINRLLFRHLLKR
jgi:peptidoglycan/xylan/chitin deacetylase (PgdA/CDA1 family)